MISYADAEILAMFIEPSTSTDWAISVQNRSFQVFLLVDRGLLEFAGYNGASAHKITAMGLAALDDFGRREKHQAEWFHGMTYRSGESIRYGDGVRSSRYWYLGEGYVLGPLPYGDQGVQVHFQGKDLPYALPKEDLQFTGRDRN